MCKKSKYKCPKCGSTCIRVRTGILGYIECQGCKYHTFNLQGAVEEWNKYIKL